MASQGPFLPSGVREDTTHGTHTWVHKTNAKSSDNNYAFSSGNADFISYYFIADDFQEFNIPDGAYIDGIQFQLERKGPGGFSTIQDHVVKIVKNGSIVGSNFASGGTWGTSDATIGYGTSTEKWGQSWLAADINASGFGFAISVSGDFSVSVYSGLIDSIKAEVFYSDIGANLLGVGNLSSAPQANWAGSTSLNGVGIIGINAQNLAGGSQSVLGAGLISLSAALAQNASVALTGVGLLNTTPHPEGMAGLYGSGILAALATMNWGGITALTGIGNLNAAAYASYGGNSSLNGIGLLSTNGSVNLTDDLNLYLVGHDSGNQSLNLFLHAGTFTETNKSLNLSLPFGVSADATGIFSSIDLFIQTGRHSGILDLFLLGAPSDVQDKNLDLYTYGVAHNLAQSIELFLANSGISTSLNLYVEGLRLTEGSDPFYPSAGYIPFTGTIDLYIQRNENSTINLFLMNSETTGSLNLYSVGAYTIDSGIDLFLPSYDILTKNMNLFTHGNTIA
jgi:hypothetical protein